ncbi:MAG: hypothetical protein FJ004_00570 [Chloroflexi bacterium]|nr:hypothetical protein [Chloroflexota bacterium]
MNRFQIGGMLICLVCVILAGLFIWGLVAGEPWRFWAIAAPVIVIFLGALGIGFSIGRLMSSTAVEAPSHRSKAKQGSAPSTSA